MIRAHSVAHDATLRESPVEWYLSRIEEIRSERPELGLYVAADTDAAFVQVARRFPDCVGQTDKGAYNSRPALQAAVADLYLLAGSCHILGPHYSSFPELARVPLGERRGPRDVDVGARDALRGAGRADRRNAVAARASEPGPQLTSRRVAVAARLGYLRTVRTTGCPVDSQVLPDCCGAFMSGARMPHPANLRSGPNSLSVTAKSPIGAGVRAMFTVQPPSLK